MNANMVTLFRRVGWLLFILMWIPFVCIFAGMAQEFGSAGQQFAEFVDGFIPGLLTARGSEPSQLTLIGMVATFGLMFAAMAFLFGGPLLGGLQNRKILRTGRPATARIADELNKQYTLGYASSRPPDGTWRSIRVRVRDGRYLARARRGYYALPPTNAPRR